MKLDEERLIKDSSQSSEIIVCGTLTLGSSWVLFCLFVLLIQICIVNTELLT